MSNDRAIDAALNAMLKSIVVPPVPLTEIRGKISQQSTIGVIDRQRNRSLPVAAAALVAALVIAVPLISPAIVQNLEARYRAALVALGGIAPPAVPKRILSKLTSQNETLASAQSRVNFTIVPPAGLPRDAALYKITTSGTGVYSKETHSWRVGPQEVVFVFRRAGGRKFELIADRYDPAGEQPPKYIFEARDPTANGQPVLIKHENFAWRNGNQIMLATEGVEISASEIRAIQAAMHGKSVPRRELHARDFGRTMKVRVITP